MNKFIYIFLIFSCLLTGCNDISYEKPIDTNSFDYRYSKARFQVEGYSTKDSETAARAIYKFNQAQKNRNR